MFPPIAFSVIHQCLDKMGLPQPAMRVLSCYKLPDGTQTAEYRLAFASYDIADWLIKQGHAVRPVTVDMFKKAVSEAFATDITILDEVDSSQPGTIALIAHVRVPPHPKQMEMFS